MSSQQYSWLTINDTTVLSRLYSELLQSSAQRDDPADATEKRALIMHIGAIHQANMIGAAHVQRPVPIRQVVRPATPAVPLYVPPHMRADGDLAAAVAASLRTQKDSDYEAAIIASTTTTTTTTTTTWCKVVAGDVPVLQPLARDPIDDMNDIDQLTPLLQGAMETLVTVRALNDPLQSAIAESRIHRIDQRIRQVRGDEKHHTHEAHELDQETKIIGPYREPENKDTVAVRTIGKGKNSHRLRLYTDGTAASSACLTHVDVSNLVLNGNKIDWIERNKCFFIQCFKYYQDHWQSIGIHSPSNLLIEFRRGGVIDNGEMMSDTQFPVFARGFNIKLGVCVLKRDPATHQILGYIDQKVYGTGDMQMYANLDINGRHYPNGAE